MDKDKAAKYRELSAESLRVAAQTESASVRRFLLNMSERWLVLARLAERSEPPQSADDPETTPETKNP
jgi:hypothetical protein